MGKIKDEINRELRAAGREFRTKHGTDTLHKELYQATKYGALKNLRNDMGTIENIAKKRETQIRRGTYQRKQRRQDYRKILSENPGFTKKEKLELKLIIEHWGTQGGAPAAATPTPTPKAVPRLRADEIPRFDLAPEKKSRVYQPKVSGNRSANTNYFSGPASPSAKSPSSGRRPKLVR